MPVSSAQFGAALTADATTRRWVFLCGCLATAAGIVIVLAMPLAMVSRLSLALLWLLESLRELANFRRGTSRLHELHLDASGKVTVIAADGSVAQGTLMSGSMVLKRKAWLRLRFADGQRHGELFRRRPGGDADWHRLQLIWRQRREAFGRQDGS